MHQTLRWANDPERLRWNYLQPECPPRTAMTRHRWLTRVGSGTQATVITAITARVRGH